jgi:hypothetical protein
MLVPHHGAPFTETLFFTDHEKANTFWLFLVNRECVEWIELSHDKEKDAWYYD